MRPHSSPHHAGILDTYLQENLDSSSNVFLFHKRGLSLVRKNICRKDGLRMQPTKEVRQWKNRASGIYYTRTGRRAAMWLGRGRSHVCESRGWRGAADDDKQEKKANPRAAVRKQESFRDQKQAVREGLRWATLRHRWVPIFVNLPSFFLSYFANLCSTLISGMYKYRHNAICCANLKMDNLPPHGRSINEE